MKTNIKRRTYQTKSRKNEKAKYKLLAAVSILAFTAVYFTAYALEVVRPVSSYFPRATVVRAEDHSEDKLDMVPETVEQTIRRLAKEANFKWEDYLVRLLNCESRLDPLAVNDRNNKPAHSKDRGIAQINNYFHPSITDAQAFDLEWSVKWTMDKINKGGQKIWVCNKHVLKNPNKYNP